MILSAKTYTTMIAILVTMSSNNSVIEYISTNAYGGKNKWTDYDSWVCVCLMLIVFEWYGHETYIDTNNGCTQTFLWWIKKPLTIVVSILSATELFRKSFHINFCSHIVVDVQMSIVNSFPYISIKCVLTFMSCERNKKQQQQQLTLYVQCTRIDVTNLLNFRNHFDAKPHSLKQGKRVWVTHVCVWKNVGVNQITKKIPPTNK